MKKTMKRISAFAMVLALMLSSAAFAATRYVTSSVHFRTGAGRQYRSIRVLQQGTKVKTLGAKKKVKTANKTSTWVKVSYNGKTGWICAGYLTSKAPEEEGAQ